MVILERIDKMTKRYRQLMAKSSPDTGQMWLPLWMHLEDTAGVMRKLVASWIPEAVVNATPTIIAIFSSRPNSLVSL